MCSCHTHRHAKLVPNQWYSNYKIKLKKTQCPQNGRLWLAAYSPSSIPCYALRPSAPLEMLSSVIQTPVSPPSLFLTQNFAAWAHPSAKISLMGVFHSDVAAYQIENVPRNWIYSRAQLLRIMLIHGPWILGVRHSAKQGRHRNGKWERKRPCWPGDVRG